MGNDVVLTDQESILAQMVENARSNFGKSFVDTTGNRDETSDAFAGKHGKIYVQPLSWSRNGFHHLLKSTGYQNGFDIVLNCDCVYEPLYGKSWELLAEVIDECLKVNPKCIIVTSVERRNGDGIDLFTSKMEELDNVSLVEKVLNDDSRDLELYITRGTI